LYATAQFHGAEQISGADTVITMNPETGALTVVHVAERTVTPFNQAFISSYALFDLGAAYTSTFRGNELTIRVTGQNITDEKYFSSIGANLIGQCPPRMIKLSVATRF
jgi:iron complex outermembrane receptor protein